jgi:hypothetical protein
MRPVDLRRYAGTTGLIGGVAWGLHYLVELDVLWWAGLALLTLACVAAGASVVSPSAPALRVFVALAVPALVGSVWWVLRDGVGSADAVDGLVGAAIALAAIPTLSAARADARGDAPGDAPGDARGMAADPS